MKLRWLAPARESDLWEDESNSDGVCAQDLSRAFSGTPTTAPALGFEDDFFRILHGRWKDTARSLSPEEWETLAGKPVKPQAPQLTPPKRRPVRGKTVEGGQ